MSERLCIPDTDHISLHQRGDLQVTTRIAARGDLELAVTSVSLEESMRGWLGRQNIFLNGAIGECGIMQMPTEVRRAEGGELEAVVYGRNANG